MKSGAQGRRTPVDLDAFEGAGLDQQAQAIAHQQPDEGSGFLELEIGAADLE